MTLYAKRAAILAKVAVYAALVGITAFNSAVAQVQIDLDDGVPSGSRLSIGTGLRWDYNPDQVPDGEATHTGLISFADYSYSWETPSTALIFKAGGDYVLGAQSNDFDAPYLDVSFIHEMARTRVSSAFRYDKGDISSSTYSEASDGSIDIASGSGGVAQSRMMLGFEGGIDAPLSYELSGEWRQTDFSGAVSASHFDNDTLRGEARATAQLSPMTSVVFDVMHEDFSKNDDLNTERTTDLARISVVQRLDRITVARFGVGERRTSLSSEVENTTASGLAATVSLRREHSGGDSQLRYTRDINKIGAWQTLSIGRTNALSNGAVEWSLGVTDTSRGNVEMIGDLTYRQSLKRDAFALGVTRRYGVNDDGDEEMVSRANLTLDHAFDDVSGVNVRLSGTALMAVNANDAEYDARIAYRRDIIEGVSLEAGVRFQVFDEADYGLTRSGRAFLTLSRDFSTR
ncbi:hypothetical protein [Celeribacter marinus]|uniref:hypothetical protein n=1 Tax=Celeribacter marinus TaxID=1397108 RepID=UPI003F6B4E35